MTKKKFWVFATLLWMAVIFFMSAAPSDESSHMSLELCRMIGRIFVPGFNAMSPENQLIFQESIEFIVRKLAHFTEYTILGVLLSGTVMNFMQDYRRGSSASAKENVCRDSVNTAGFPYLRAALTAIIIGALYAMSDEFHQLFVPGRSCSLRDVLIDSCGVSAGVGMFMLVVSSSKDRSCSL